MAAAAFGAIASSLVGSATSMGSSLGAAAIQANAQKEIAAKNIEANHIMQIRELGLSQALTEYVSELPYNKLTASGFSPSDAALLSFGGGRSAARKVWTPQGNRLASNSTGMFVGSVGYHYDPALASGVASLSKVAYSKLKPKSRTGNYSVNSSPRPSVDLSWDGYNPNWGGGSVNSHWGSTTSSLSSWSSAGSTRPLFRPR